MHRFKEVISMNKKRMRTVDDDDFQAGDASSVRDLQKDWERLLEVWRRNDISETIVIANRIRNALKTGVLPPQVTTGLPREDPIQRVMAGMACEVLALDDFVDGISGREKVATRIAEVTVKLDLRAFDE